MARRTRTTPEAPSRKIELTQRDCLRCDRVFPSQGAYNRLCKTCLEFLTLHLRLTRSTPSAIYSPSKGELWPIGAAPMRRLLPTPPVSCGLCDEFERTR